VIFKKIKQNSLYSLRLGFLPIEDNISQILKPIFVKKKDNFLLINSLNKNWQKIAGEKCWQFCSPKKVKFENNKEYKKKYGGILTITANNSATAFYLEASANQIIENIAAYFGYKIVSKIIIVQEPKILSEEKVSKIDKNISKKSQDLIDDATLKIKDLELKEILQKLGKSILK
jgi:hypothetical protein